MSHKIFRPEDFLSIRLSCSEAQRQGIADIANRKLESLLGPYVRFGNNGPATWIVMGECEAVHPFDTHRARLFNVQEIVKEPCEHEPKAVNIWTLDKYICAKCGAPLKAVWHAEGE